MQAEPNLHARLHCAPALTLRRRPTPPSSRCQAQASSWPLLVSSSMHACMPQSIGSSRLSCSVAKVLPVHRQPVHMTLPVPAQKAQLQVAVPLLVGSVPLPTQLPQVRYPVPSQYRQRSRCCFFTLFVST